MDEKSYKTKCVRLTAALDVGTIINRITVDGQNYGGITQGMGMGLTEDFDDLKVHTSLRPSAVSRTRTMFLTISRFCTSKLLVRKVSWDRLVAVKSR